MAYTWILDVEDREKNILVKNTSYFEVQKFKKNIKKEQKINNFFKIGILKNEKYFTLVKYYTNHGEEEKFVVSFKVFSDKFKCLENLEAIMLDGFTKNNIKKINKIFTEEDIVMYYIIKN